MTRYTGTVVTVDHDDRDFAFIDIKTVTKIDGSPADLDTDKDIFIHHSDAPGALVVGDVLSFAVTNDKKRRNAFRASGARIASGFPIEAGIEIHFDQRVLDHPMVPIRWCIKPAALRAMEENPEMTWYLAIIAWNGAASKAKTVLQTAISLERIATGRGYLSFIGSGSYDIVAYLVRTPESVRAVEKMFDATHVPEINVWKDRDKYELTAEEWDLGFAKRPGRGTVISHSFMSVDVPAEIFAKPLPAWQKNWLAYFNLHRPRDECSMRWRLLFGFTLGPAIYAFVELVKRLYMLCLGALHLVLGGSPLPVWREAFSPRLSAYISGMKGMDEYRTLMDYSGWKGFLFPLPWSILGVALFLWIYVPGSRELLGSIGIVIVLLVFVLGFLCFAGDRIGNSFSERRDAKVKQRQRRELQQVATFASCDYPRHNGPITVRLIWSGIKRKVCRTYG